MVMVLLARKTNHRILNRPEKVFLEDLNSDGRLDLMVTNGSDDISVSLGNGDGSFSPETIYQGEGDVTSVISIDLDEDGYLDLVTANFRDDTISILLGNGDGSFDDDRRNYYAGVEPKDIAASDLNEDGHLDLIIVNEDVDGLSVLLGNGNGSFLILSARDYPLTQSPSKIITADLNGDEENELITIDSNNILSVFSQSKGTFYFNNTKDLELEANFIEIEDFNNDGYLDLLATNKTDTVSLFLGTRDNSFSSGTEYFVGQGGGETGHELIDVAVSDLNGDGFEDFVTSSYYSSTVSVFLGNGDGSFTESGDNFVGENPNEIVTTDFNGDGFADLVTANSSYSISYLSGNGDGTFAETTDIALEVEPYDLVTGDLNGDGFKDLAISSYESQTVSVILNNGDGTLAQPNSHITPGEYPEKLLVKRYRWRWF